MVQSSLLKALLKKDNYNKYRSFLSFEEFTKEAHPVLHAIDELHKQKEGDLHLEDVANTALAKQFPKRNEPLVKATLDQMVSDSGQETVQSLLEKHKRLATSRRLAVLAANYSEGQGDLNKIVELAEELKETPTVFDDFVTDDITEIIKHDVLKPGLRWRLDCLNKSIGSLRKGNFLFLFARPETGKTTFLASEVGYMVGQLGQEQGPVLWFNNEEHGHNVKLRQYQAVLGARIDQLKKYPERAKAAFMEKTKGKLKLIDEAVLTKQKVESIAEQHKPSLIVIDQLDKVEGFSADRKDLELGDIYRWARELAKKYCPVIGVCQADGTAEGVRYLTMAHVANSKTSKAAEADFIIGIGKDNQPGWDYIRFISVLKNKGFGDDDSDPALRHGTFQVRIVPEIARYEDINQQED
jgi:replicative DNA helicase